MREYDVYRIMDLVESIGEETVQGILSDFSCEYEDGVRNFEAEKFLRESAVEFSRQKISITYLVMDNKSRLVGYFALAHKPIVVCDDTLKSNTNKKRMRRHAKLDSQLCAYSVSAFLIAQFSKNYGMPVDERISGTDLMDIALSLIKDIQQQIGGGVVFLECRDNQKLFDFYTRVPQSFFQYGERFSENNNVKYIQLMRFV